jgi:hypothetical protein
LLTVTLYCRTKDHFQTKHWLLEVFRILQRYYYQYHPKGFILVRESISTTLVYFVGFFYKDDDIRHISVQNHMVDVSTTMSSNGIRITLEYEKKVPSFPNIFFYHYLDNKINVYLEFTATSTSDDTIINLLSVSRWNNPISRREPNIGSETEYPFVLFYDFTRHTDTIVIVGMVVIIGSRREKIDIEV